MTSTELKSKRKSLGLTQAQLAKLLGVSQEMVSEMESGVKAVPTTLARKVYAGDW